MKITLRRPGKTISGRPGRSRRCSRNRKPILWMRRRTSNSGKVSLPRMRDIFRDRCDGVIVSAMHFLRRAGHRLRTPGTASVGGVCPANRRPTPPSPGTRLKWGKLPQGRLGDRLNRFAASRQEQGNYLTEGCRWRIEGPYFKKRKRAPAPVIAFAHRKPTTYSRPPEGSLSPSNVVFVRVSRST